MLNVTVCFRHFVPALFLPKNQCDNCTYCKISYPLKINSKTSVKIIGMAIFHLGNREVRWLMRVMPQTSSVQNKDNGSYRYWLLSKYCIVFEGGEMLSVTVCFRHFVPALFLPRNQCDNCSDYKSSE